MSKLTITVVSLLVLLTLAGVPGASIVASAQTTDTLRLTVEDAIRLARERGAAAQQARSTLDAARWQDRSFLGGLLPQVSLSATVPSMNRSIIPVTQPDGSTLFLPQRQTESSLALNLTQRLPVTGGDLSISSDLTRIDRGGQSDSRLWRSTPVQISLRQNIFRTNALSWDRRAQDLRGRMAERQFAESMEDVAISAISLFFDAYTAQFDIQNATNSVALNDTLYKISQGRYEVGKIGENDLLQSELALIRAQTSLESARIARERAIGSLRISLRLPSDAPVVLVPPSDIEVVQVDTAVATMEALRNRSQILDLELQDLQARRRVADSRRSSGVGATLTAAAGFNQSAAVFDDAYNSLLQQQRLALTVQMPLYLGGARSAGVQAAKADEQRTAVAIENTRLTVLHEVKFAALDIEQSRRQVASAAKADSIAQLRAESAKNRYLNGTIQINEFYSAQSERDNVRQAYVQSLRGYFGAYYRLRRLTLFDFATGGRLVRE